MWLLLVASAFADPDPMFAQVDDVAAIVARLRGDAAPEPVHAETLDAAGLGAFLDKALAEDPTAAQNPAIVHMLSRFGLLPAETDLAAAYKSVMAGQIAGLYDPPSKTLFVVRKADGLSGAFDRMLLAHEIGHALDDRVWKLDQVQKEHAGTLDQQLVVSSLIEGSATVQMMRFLFEEFRTHKITLAEMMVASAADSARFDTLPKDAPFFYNAVLAPYLLGTAYLCGGAMDAQLMSAPADPTRSRLKAAMAAVPTTTATLLHPSAPPVEPVTVDLAALVPGIVPAHEDRLGELMIAAATGRSDPSGMEAMRSDAWTNKVGSGWIGDQWLSGALPDGRTVDVWVSAWAEPADRDELAKVWKKKHKDAPLSMVGEHVAVATWGLKADETRALTTGLASAAWTRAGVGWAP